jgi:hypothetical protein
MIIKRRGKYLPDLNFNKAHELGFSKYVEMIKPSKFKQYITSKTQVLGVLLAGAVLVTAGYLMRTEKKKYTH